MHTSLTEIFKQKCKNFTEKTVTYTSTCCGITLSTTRRDMNYVLLTFLLSLEDMIKKTGKVYHDFRHVIDYSKKKFNTTPSDYSLLESRWNLIAGFDGKNNHKYKTLTSFGKQFINNELAVSKSYYKVPQTETILWSKDKVYMKDIIKKEVVKEDKKPFFNK